VNDDIELVRKDVLTKLQQFVNALTPGSVDELDLRAIEVLLSVWTALGQSEFEMPGPGDPGGPPIIEPPPTGAIEPPPPWQEPGDTP